MTNSAATFYPALHDAGPQCPPTADDGKKRLRFAKLCEAARTIVEHVVSMKPQSYSPTVASPEKIDPKWAWHHRALLRLAQKLRKAQAEHELAATAHLEKSGVDQIEVARDETDHEVVLAELHAEEDQLTEIEAALQRLRKGTYGLCEETGLPISPARLQAIPWTRYSRSATERNEQRARAGHTKRSF